MSLSKEEVDLYLTLQEKIHQESIQFLRKFDYLVRGETSDYDPSLFIFFNNGFEFIPGPYPYFYYSEIVASKEEIQRKVDKWVEDQKSKEEYLTDLAKKLNKLKK